MYRAANRRWGGAALASGGTSGAGSPLGGEMADLHPDGWKMLRLLTNRLLTNRQLTNRQLTNRGSLASGDSITDHHAVNYDRRIKDNDKTQYKPF